MLEQREHQGGACSRSPLYSYDLHVETRLTPEEIAALGRLQRGRAGPMRAGLEKGAASR